MQRAIITYNWTHISYGEAFEKVIIPRLESLSKKLEAELVISNSKNPIFKEYDSIEDYNIINQYNKSYALKNLVSKFERSLCIDPSIIVSKKIPNFFEMFSLDNFYAILDGNNGDENCFHRFQEIANIQSILGSAAWSYGYYDTSLMLLKKDHSKIFQDHNDKICFNVREETKINYLLRKNGFSHQKISKQFNSNALNVVDSKNTIENRNIFPPEILSNNAYAVNVAHFPDEIKNDYIFKLDSIMS